MRQDKLSQERQEGEGFEWMVNHPGVQVRMFENVRGDRIDLPGRRRLVPIEAGKPAGDVITVGIEILHGVDHPSKRLPRGTRIPSLKTGENDSALFLNIGIGGIDPVIIEMKMVPSKLVLQAVLSQVGAQDDLEGTRTYLRANRLLGDIYVMTTQHFTFAPGSDYPDPTIRSISINACADYTPEYNTHMKFYTGTGDDGTTGLLGEGRVSKTDARIETLGALDESTAALGLARAQANDPRSGKILLEAQRDLYKLMAEVAATPGQADRFQAIDAGRVAWLEAQVDMLASNTSMPREFIIPGDTLAGAALSLARAVIRRAERRVVELSNIKEISNPELTRYLNRLSSLCFVLELVENNVAGKATTLAKE